MPDDHMPDDHKARIVGPNARIFATGYLRLLARHGPNWREHWELEQKAGAEDSSKKCSNRLDFSANKSMKYAGKRTITLTLTRS